MPKAFVLPHLTSWTFDPYPENNGREKKREKDAALDSRTWSTYTYLCVCVIISESEQSEFLILQ